MKKYKSSVSGFTLIELMIAVLIIGILIRIAYPSYLSQVQKSREVSARTALMDFAGREAKFYSTNNAYSASLATLGYNVAGNAVSAPIPDAVSHYYDLTVVVAGNTFTGTATPVNAQANDVCGSYTIDNLGVKLPAIQGCW